MSNNKSPLQRYQDQIQNKTIQVDPAQEAAVLQLEKIYQAFILKHHYLFKLSQKIKSKMQRAKPIQGLYIWGEVGRGKTFLMDLFYQSLPFKQKKRYHFHRFMRFVHQSLTHLQGHPNPLKQVAALFSRHHRVLCFDEFHVSDIADAMILSELFKYLFAQGVTLIATSNIPPDDLYENGLQRDRFLPAIALIHRYTDILHLTGPIDFRMQFLAQAEIYHYPLDTQAEKNLMHYFTLLAPDIEMISKNLSINDHSLTTRFCAENVVWFDFDALCDTPRSAEDYIEIARCYHTVLISDVKIMHENKENAAKRFIMMIDEFYDRHVVLIMSGEAPLEQLYQGTRHQFEFQRTLSRLTQMQSAEYLAQVHLS